MALLKNLIIYLLTIVIGGLSIPYKLHGYTIIWTFSFEKLCLFLIMLKCYGMILMIDILFVMFHAFMSEKILICICK